MQQEDKHTLAQLTDSRHVQDPFKDTNTKIYLKRRKNVAQKKN